jgi:hypothetical protein
MSYENWEAIAEIPWWVYYLIIVLYYLAYQATKPRTVSIKAILIPEGILTVSFLAMLLLLFFFSEIHTHNLIFFSFALLPGTLLGWIAFRLSGFRAIQN